MGNFGRGKLPTSLREIKVFVGLQGSKEIGGVAIRPIAAGQAPRVAHDFLEKYIIRQRVHI
jgi:hypothetical protein